MLVETESPMVPANPLRPVRVIVEEPDTLGDFWLGLTGPAEIEKSGTGMTTVMVVVWLNEPDVAVTFTRYVPGSIVLLAVIVS